MFDLFDPEGTGNELQSDLGTGQSVVGSDVAGSGDVMLDRGLTNDVPESEASASFWSESESESEDDLVAPRELVSRLAGSRNLADYAVVNMLADVLDSGEWSIAGINSPNHWLSWHLGLNSRHSARIIKISERRAELGIAFQYFAEGVLSIDQMSLIATYCPVGHDQTVSALAVNATIPQLRRILRDYEYDDATPNGSATSDAVGEESSETAGADADPEDDEASGGSSKSQGVGASDGCRQHEPADCSLSDGLDCRMASCHEEAGCTSPDCDAANSPPRGDAGGDSIGAVAGGSSSSDDYNYCPEADLPAGLSSDELAQPYRGFGYGFDDDGHFRMWLRCGPDDGAELEAAFNQARARLKAETGETDVSGFESFLTLVRAGVEADTSGSRASDNKVLVHLEENELSAWANGLRPHLHLGPLLPQQAFDLLSCDASIQVLVSRFGRAVALGRTQKLIPHWLRQIVINRDHGCRAPGCAAQRWLDVHHITHWSKGGKTDPDNLVTLCRKHHREHHRGAFSIVGCPETPVHENGLRFFARNRREIMRSRPDPEPPPQGWYEHGSGEPYDSTLIDIPPNNTASETFDLAGALGLDDHESIGHVGLGGDVPISHLGRDGPDHTSPRCGEVRAEDACLRDSARETSCLEGSGSQAPSFDCVGREVEAEVDADIDEPGSETAPCGDGA